MLAPKTSVVRSLYEPYAQPLTRIVHGLSTSWGSSASAATCSSIIELAVWSSCNRFIAISFRDPMIVDIIDSVTLQKLQTVKFKKEYYYSRRALSFSPDSRTLTCSGYWGGGPRLEPLEAFVVTWDLQTGGVVSTIEREILNSYNSAKACIAYSTDGKTVGVLHQDFISTTISIYDVFSGLYSHDVYHDAHKDIYGSVQRHSLYDQHWCDIWTHGESLRFATAGPTAITVWEVGFLPGTTSKRVDVLSIPDSVTPTALVGLYPPEPRVNAQFLPSLRRLALLHYKALGGVLVWDAEKSEYLLHYKDISFYPSMTFSSDGRFFACSTAGSEVYLWKGSPSGYALHAILKPSTRRITPLLSPNGESIITYGFGSSVVRLWHTRSFTATSTIATIRAPPRIENFVLEFLPERSSAVVARQKDNTMTVLDLKSGLPQLTIDAGMEIYGLAAIGNTVTAIGKEKATTWNLPGETLIPEARMNVEDSVRTMNFGDVRNGYVSAASISFDSRYIAITAEDYPGSGRLYLYNSSTGLRLDDAIVRGSTLWFLPGSHSVGWVADGNKGEVRRITTRDTLDYTVPIGDIERGQWGSPHGSSHGYQVTNDGWILSPSGRRLLMLPPPWRSDMVRRMWNGRFLALLHGALPEPVILELEP